MYGSKNFFALTREEYMVQKFPKQLVQLRVLYNSLRAGDVAQGARFGGLVFRVVSRMVSRGGLPGLRAGDVGQGARFGGLVSCVVSRSLV